MRARSKFCAVERPHLVEVDGLMGLADVKLDVFLSDAATTSAIIGFPLLLNSEEPHLCYSQLVAVDFVMFS